jgi:hypothetical protein
MRPPLFIDRQVVIFRFPRLAASENALISPGQKEDDCLTINSRVACDALRCRTRHR